MNQKSKPIRNLQGISRQIFNQLLRDHVRRALNTHNLTSRFSYRPMMEAATGLPYSAVEKLQSLNQAMNSGFITRQAVRTTFILQPYRLHVLFVDTNPGKRFQYDTMFTLHTDIADKLLANASVLKLLLEATKQIHQVIKSTHRLPAIHRICPELFELISSSLTKYHEMVEIDDRVARNLTPQESALIAPTRKYAGVYRTLLVAPKSVKSAVKTVDGYDRSLIFG